MFLRKINNYIERKMQGRKFNDDFRISLDMIRNTLIKSNGTDLERIKRVLTYIEMMPVSRLFSPKIVHLDSLLKKENYPVLEDLRLQQELETEKIFTPQPLSDSQSSILGSIHSALLKAYLKTWTYKYPLNENGEIINKTIQTWQTKFKEESHTDTVQDFNRSITIRGKKCESNSLAAEINGLINQCSVYKKEDKQKLLAWIRAKGGQEMDRFITLSTIAGDFTNDKEGSGPSIGFCEKVKMDWHQEHGKLAFEFDYFIKTLQYGNEVMLNYNGVVNKFTYITEELEQRLSGKIALPPLMRVQAKIELNIVNDVITPQIVAYAVTGYNDSIKSPEKKYKSKAARPERNYPAIEQNQYNTPRPH